MYIIPNNINNQHTMSTFYNFISKVEPYLKTVRKLKTHVSYDLFFSDKWVMPKITNENIEVVKSGSENGYVLLSFVCPINEDSVTKVEELIEQIIKTNREREEKDKLFRSKVQELKNIFEKQNLEDLKSLKFDVDEIDSIINSNGEESNETGDREGVVTTEVGTETNS